MSWQQRGRCTVDTTTAKSPEPDLIPPDPSRAAGSSNERGEEREDRFLTWDRCGVVGFVRRSSSPDGRPTGVDAETEQRGAPTGADRLMPRIVTG
jgi:hypothetical protein